ncbi:DUF5930 domain-containing protein [Hasllibacter halocynthiae]|uniref:DUF5930 domain-containing protein n=1 Tax=Hasllibacter halocynthiae TaxID=595589 RepID=UPI001FEB882A|nr:DUF5930 domain-containing protein [Hasllibacter halocynthiae]
MKTPTIYRLHVWLERILPERRVFLRSDTTTRYIRLRPGTQLVALLGGSAILAWCIIASAIVLMDSIGSGSVRDQAKREQQIYERRLNALAGERDDRAAEAAQARERFDTALAQLGDLQTQLLEAEHARAELERGIEISHARLRESLGERDALGSRLAALSEGEGVVPAAEGAELDAMVAALATTAAERDEIARTAALAEEEADRLRADLTLIERRNDEIFTQLEEAVSVSIAPLETMFRNAGMPPDRILDEVRRGYSGQGGPMEEILSTSGRSSVDAARAAAILEQMEEMDLYRIAAQSLPFANPVPSGNYRQTSAFGPRRDPIRGGTRMHNGLDFAGARGTPIHATASGEVIRAGWFSGYGRTVEIRHAHGVMTRYAHLSSISVDVGQQVSRGERIGGMGTTGRSTGVHLHYEVRIGDRAVNPMTWIRAGRDVF